MAGAKKKKKTNHGPVEHETHFLGHGGHLGRVRWGTATVMDVQWRTTQ